MYLVQCMMNMYVEKRRNHCNRSVVRIGWTAMPVYTANRARVNRKNGLLCLSKVLYRNQKFAFSL